ncbi:MAG: hypothetical protein QM820_02545 [Minicystis sp.]
MAVHRYLAAGGLALVTIAAACGFSTTGTMETAKGGSGGTIASSSSATSSSGSTSTTASSSGMGGATSSSSAATTGSGGAGGATVSSSVSSSGLPTHCASGTKDGGETGVDCGGGECLPCGPTQGCKVDSDCLGGSCAGGICCLTACSGACKSCNNKDTGMADGVCNIVTVMAKDPGGICASTVGGKCDTAGNCACSNNAKDGAETGKDCGGPDCKALCDNGEGCGAGGDCKSNVCYDAGGGTKVCCDKMCTGNCNSCNLSYTFGTTTYSWVGQCVPLPNGDHGKCPNGQGCNNSQQCVPGGVTGQGCSGGGNCISGQCSSQSNQCRPDNQPAGLACVFDGWCLSNDCDDTTLICH